MIAVIGKALAQFKKDGIFRDFDVSNSAFNKFNK